MLINRLSGVLLPFFIAWLVAYLIYPLVKFFQYRLKLKSRILSIFCTLIVIAGIITEHGIARAPFEEDFRRWGL